VDPEVLVARLVARQQLFFHVGDADGGHDGRHDVLQRGDAVQDLPGGDPARPAQQQRRAEAALPAQALLAPERRGAPVGPGELLGAVVGGKDHDGVVGDAEGVQLGEQLAHHPVQLLHPVGVQAQPGLVAPAV